MIPDTRPDGFRKPVRSFRWREECRDLAGFPQTRQVFFKLWYTPTAPLRERHSIRF